MRRGLEIGRPARVQEGIRAERVAARAPAGGGAGGGAGTWARILSKMVAGLVSRSPARWIESHRPFCAQKSMPPCARRGAPPQPSRQGGACKPM